MRLKTIIDSPNSNSYLETLKIQDSYYNDRVEMLEEARRLFQSGVKLSEMSKAERGIFLGKNSNKTNTYGFDVNLFGAPGGNGEVKRIISSNFASLDEFFSDIPRHGPISQEDYSRLTDLFKSSVIHAGCNKVPFVLFTRLLAITRPDTFVTSAASALDEITKALGVTQIKNDFQRYWEVLLLQLHKRPIFNSQVGDASSNLLAMIDGVIWEEEIANDGITATNQILYGPPGTGKTYHTIEVAVKAVEPTFTWENRDELKAEYDRLVGEKRIRFVTFHQSYGYEEFVEGLKAETTAEGQITYKVKDGIFKSICDSASISELHTDESINTNGRVWKLSIEGAHKNASKKYCLENSLAAIGWGATGDLSLTKRNDYFNGLGKNNQNSLNYFSQHMEEGDLVVCIDSKTSIEAIGVISGEYQYAENGLPSRQDFCHQLPVNWFSKGFSVDFKELNDNKQFNLPTCYPLSRLSVPDVLNHLKAKGVNLESQQAVVSEEQSYALVIDEINRGNISKIFGELITLIEPCKRKGTEEELSLTLPYSGKPFTVPSNLHIIGTMNTADRSLAMMDTALRRRFDFVEMMPKPCLFENKTVHGINLTMLLETINKRIEVLYDREHMLGHSFLFPVFNALSSDKEISAFSELQSAFKNKIIPLLEEYFYEDWNKIRLVLGDNQKENENLQFVREKQIKYKELFGGSYQSNDYGQQESCYELALFSDEVWLTPAAYLGIYSQCKEASDSSESE